MKKLQPEITVEEKARIQRLIKEDWFEKLQHQIKDLTPRLWRGLGMGLQGQIDGNRGKQVIEVIGTGDGSTTEFDLTYEPYDISKVAIYVGAGRMFGTVDWTISGKTIKFLTAPPSTAGLRADYQKK